MYPIKAYRPVQSLIQKPEIMSHKQVVFTNICGPNFITNIFLFREILLGCDSANNSKSFQINAIHSIGSSSNECGKIPFSLHHASTESATREHIPSHDTERGPDSYELVLQAVILKHRINPTPRIMPKYIVIRFWASMLDVIIWSSHSFRWGTVNTFHIIKSLLRQ